MVMGVNRRRGPFSSANCRTMDVPDLLNLFATVRGEELADDSLLLG